MASLLDTQTIVVTLNKSVRKCDANRRCNNSAHLPTELPRAHRMQCASGHFAPSPATDMRPSVTAQFVSTWCAINCKGQRDTPIPTGVSSWVNQRWLALVISLLLLTLRTKLSMNGIEANECATPLPRTCHSPCQT